MESNERNEEGKDAGGGEALTDAECRKRAILSKTRSRGTFNIVKVKSLNLDQKQRRLSSASTNGDATAVSDLEEDGGGGGGGGGDWKEEQRQGPPPDHAVVGTAIGLDIDSIGYTLAGTFLTAQDVCALGCTCSNLAEVVRGADFVWASLIETTFGGAYNESVARQMSGSPTPSTIRFADGNPGATPTPDAPGAATPRAVERPCKHLLLFRMQLCFERERRRILAEFSSDRARLNRWMHSERERQQANVRQKLRVRAMRRQIRALERERDALEERVREQQAQEDAVRKAAWAVAQEAAEARARALAERVAKEQAAEMRAREFAAEVAAGGGWKAERDRRRQLYGPGGGAKKKGSAACCIM